MADVRISQKSCSHSRADHLQLSTAASAPASLTLTLTSGAACHVLPPTGYTQTVSQPTRILLASTYIPSSIYYFVPCCRRHKPHRLYSMPVFDDQLGRATP